MTEKHVLVLMRRNTRDLDDVAVRVAGRHYRLFEQRSQKGLVPKKSVFFDDHDAALAEVGKLIARKTKIGYQVLTRLDDSPWVPWLDELDSAARGIAGYAEVGGLTVHENLTWFGPRESAAYLNPLTGAAAGYADMGQIASLYRWHIRMFQPETQHSAGFGFQLFRYEPDALQWSAYGGYQGGVGAGHGKITEDGDGVLRSVLLGEEFAFESAEKFRAELPRLIEFAGEGQVNDF